MKTIQVWKVEGEGAEFQTEEGANYERRTLEMEFPENQYWLDSYEREILV